MANERPPSNNITSEQEPEPKLMESIERTFESKKVPPWQNQLTLRAFVVSFILGILFTFIVMKLNLTTGIIPSLNVSAGLLGFFFVKTWTKFLDKSGLLKQPFTRQENTVIQTCVVATSGIAFSGGFGSYLFGMSEVIAKQSHEENSEQNMKNPSLGWMIAFLFVVSFLGLFSVVPLRKNMESAKELWDSLESKYMAEDASSKKFLVSNFNNYKMVDSRPVMEQYNELLRILGQFTQHGLNMDESIQVSSVIDKLPPSWKEFKHMLKHKKEELSLVQLGSHLRIEESLRVQESGKGKEKEVVKPSVNMVEGGKNTNNNKGKKRNFKDGNNGSNKKSKLACWVCGKTGHFKRDCRVAKKNNGAGTSGSGKGSKDQPQDQG